MVLQFETLKVVQFLIRNLDFILFWRRFLE